MSLFTKPGNPNKDKTSSKDMRKRIAFLKAFVEAIFLSSTVILSRMSTT